jgi:hypothetical protein
MNMKFPALPHKARLCFGSRCNRWDVYPQPQPTVIVAQNWEGSHILTEDGSQWFKTPSGYNLHRDLTTDEIETIDPVAQGLTWKKDAS